MKGLDKMTNDFQEPVRKNVRMPKELTDWLEKESKRTAIPASSLITIAVERYREQKEGLVKAGETAALLQQLIDSTDAK